MSAHFGNSKSCMMKLLGFSLAVIVWIWSGVQPHDRFTWFLETAPVFIGLPVLVWLDRRFTVTTLLFCLICFHCIILCVGGKYTYAEVPLGEWMKTSFGFSRNHYDRIGHFVQGFVPALLAREVLIRHQVVRRGFWLSLFCVSICLAFSASYEIIEWWTAALSGQAADAFLGTQGDPWDTQWDMFLALVGASLSILTLSRFHCPVSREPSKA
jgi:putative membrane protein